MRRNLLAAGVFAVALIPSMASAQQTCEQRRSNQTAGTIAGAGIGAILGSMVAGRGDRTAGAVVGGLGGGLVGNQLSRSAADCARAYGFYDDSGAWHASNVRRENARGYFDRHGAWVDGAPAGHYNRDGRWVQLTEDATAGGYYDRSGRWIPASANGYYAADGRWVAGPTTSGRYDSRGRWVSGPTTGRYDERGRWIPGRQARASDVQPGYYDQGQWKPGPVYGYYDARGRWVSVDNGENQGANHGGGWRGRDIASHEAWLDTRIRQGLNNGSLTRNEGDRALRTLATIQRDERNMRNRGGQLRPRDQMTIHARLDDLAESVRIMGRGPVYQN